MWFRLHTEIVDDPKLLDLNDKAFRIWIYLMALLKEQNGASLEDKIYLDHKNIAWKFRISLKKLQKFLKIFEELRMIHIENETGIITIVNWRKRQYCESIERVRKFREKQKQRYSNASCNGSVTLPPYTETESETNIREKEKLKEKESRAKALDVSLEILKYLVEKSGKKFNLKSKENLVQIKARLKEGYLPDDLKLIIDDKVEKWGDDPEKRDWLNPITLFRLSHIEKNLAAAKDEGAQNVTRIPIKSEPAPDEQITKLHLPAQNKAPS